MLEAPIDENDGNATAAVKALYTSCMNTGNKSFTGGTWHRMAIKPHPSPEEFS